MYEKDPVKIFVVEDDPTYLRYLEYVLNLNPDFDVTTFDNGQDCINKLHENPQIITLDYTLPDISGEEVLQSIKSHNPDINVIIISAQEQIKTAVHLLKKGAFDYITKDDDTKDRLLNTIKNARQNTSLIKEVDMLKEEIATKYQFDKNIIGNSASFQKIFKLMEKSVKTNITVSISGETGTGKEVVAKSIHYNSPRSKKPFVAVNVAAIPKDLIESELFGHEKGAFTGAQTRRIGKFEESNGGTIFLDEIGEMEIGLQAKLLRVLQEKEVTRIGGSSSTSLDLRVIVATHKDLAEEVKKGDFREDLYYRLLGLPIKLPPLRERGNDIILLAKYFLNEFSKENNLGSLKLSQEATQKLMSYPFPGNVRELKSIIELSAVMANETEITAEDITFNNLNKDQAIMSQEMTLKEYTYKIIEHFLNKYDNNVLAVAEKLDIGKSSIYRYLKEMDK